MPKKFNLISDGMLGGISSTEIRRRIKQVKSQAMKVSKKSASFYLKIGGLVSNSVIDYIIANDLY